ncbi:MAG: DUF11 domain-containing protein, partial [Bacteroidia bacterium]|nr:DUF11 domain-containing protein [Bacteroidia bacterium]
MKGAMLRLQYWASTPHTIDILDFFGSIVTWFRFVRFFFCGSEHPFTRFFLGWVGFCVAQPQLSSVEPTLTVCGPAGTVQVSLSHPGPGVLTGLTLQVTLPTGIQYVSGSVSSVPGGATEIGAGQFSLPNVPAGQTLVVTFHIRAGCGVLPLLADPNARIRNTYLVSWAGGGSLSVTSPDYAVLEPSLQYTSITNQVYNASGVGVTFTRTFTVTNAGNGALAEFSHRETWGSCLQITATSGAQVVSQSGSELVLGVGAAQFTAVGDGDALLDPGESVSFSVTYRVNCCTNLTSTFQLRWGCDNTLCRTVNATGGVNVPGGTPNLRAEHRWLVESSCYGQGTGSANRMRLRLWNTGNGPARNVQVRLRGGMGRDAIDESSISVQFANGAPIPFTVLNQQAQNQGCFTSPTMLLEVTVRIDSDILPNQEVWVEANGHTCPPPSCTSNPNNFHTTLRSFTWELRFESACGQSYSAQGTSRTRSYTPSPIQLSLPCIPIGRMRELVVRVERGPGIFILAPDGFAGSGTPSSSQYQFIWQVDLPPCASMGNQPVIWYGSDPANPANLLAWPASSPPGSTLILFTEAHRPPQWTDYSFTNSFLRIPIVNDSCRLRFPVPSCALLTPADRPPILRVSAFYNPNGNCNSPWCYSSGRGVYVLPCPDIAMCDDTTRRPPRPFEGLFFQDFSFKRISYGLPDNNQDGLPDVGGSLDMNRIALDAAMQTDTLEAYYEGFVRKHTPGGWPAAWAFLDFDASTGNTTLEALELFFRFRKASTGQVYTYQFQGASLSSIV